jgi:hypothetical protein
MKKLNLLTAVAVIALSGAVTGSAFAQVTTGVKESGKAVAEKALEGKETVQAAVSSDANKKAHEAKAKAHHNKAAKHDATAKAAGEKIGK